ncbi:MAG: sulfatase [Acidobacteria bacterium]|nr:sulfatase [Acidobacteriota bacterium]
MKRRSFLQSAGVLATPLATHAAASQSVSRKPNVLLCISDDQSWNHAGAYGSKMVKTPAFDRIAREGVLFRRNFTSNPTCSPSRSSLLTGQVFYRLEEGAQNWGTLPLKNKVYPDLLEAAGYHVGFTGKASGPVDWQASGWKRSPCGPEYNGKRLKPPNDGIVTFDYAGNFREFLSKRKPGQPFCFWYGGIEPHRAYTPGCGLKAGKKLSEAELPPWLPDNDDVRSDMLDYAFEIEWFDNQLGKMIQILEAAGELDNTLILVTADNGMPFPRSKGQLYDSGARVPLAVRWGSRVKGGRVVEDFISFPDYAPTILEATGLSKTQEMTGRSFLNVLQSAASGQIDPTRDHVITGRERYYPELLPFPCRALRTSDYLYIRNYRPDRCVAGVPPGYHDGEFGPAAGKHLLAERGQGAGRYRWEITFGMRPAEELYDLAKDPDQMHNVASDKAYAAMLENLGKQMEAELVATGDPRAMGRGDVFDSYPARMWDSKAHRMLPHPQ